MANEQYNPIRSIDGVTVSCPSSYIWKLEDVSATDAGRTEDMKMDKKRIGQVIGVELSWDRVSIANTSRILKLFNPEYITVEYLDAMQGLYCKKEFYVGNRSVPLFNARLGVWENISFNLIARGG